MEKCRVNGNKRRADQHIHTFNNVQKMRRRPKAPRRLGQGQRPGRGASPLSSTAHDQVDLERHCTCLISKFIVQVLSDVHDALTIKPVPDVHELQHRGVSQGMCAISKLPRCR
jgi:hypothetical protein